MILDINSLSKITKGCVSIKEVDGFFEFNRFTDSQLSYFTDEYEFFSKFTAGVVFDFYTGSDFIRFDFFIERFSSRFNSSVDVYENGVFTKSYKEDTSLVTMGSFEYVMKNKGKKRVTIYLPFTSNMRIKNFEVEDYATIESYVYNKRLLCLGDSITQGFDSYHTSNSYACQLARSFDGQLLNQGIGGHHMDVHSLDENLEFDPDVVVVAYGTNDWKIHDNLDAFCEQTKKYLQKINQLYGSKTVYINLPWWRMDAEITLKPMGTFNMMRDIFRFLLKDYPHFIVGDGYAPIPKRAESFGDGRVHPNEETMGRMADYILERIKS